MGFNIPVAEVPIGLQIDSLDSRVYAANFWGRFFRARVNFWSLRRERGVDLEMGGYLGVNESNRKGLLPRILNCHLHSLQASKRVSFFYFLFVYVRYAFIIMEFINVNFI